VGTSPAGERLPDLSVIVPTRNRHDLLRVCLDGLQRTEYPGRLEVIVIDNGSNEPATLEYLAQLDTDFARVIRDDGPFNFASLNNRAVESCSSGLLCFLNNDIEIRHTDWLSIMAHQAMHDEVGAVGAQLLYPDGLIQHAGVVIGIGGAAAHAHRTLHPQAEGYFQRHRLPQFVCAVTAACMVMRRDRFEAVKGFDEERFAVSFNDVDLCLRLRDKGWEILYEPRASLVHHESVSRGLDHDPQRAARQAREVRALQQLWHTGDRHPDKGHSSSDPFHHPGLSPLSEHFVLRV
jgi:GT2 family glycosyltransferase